MVDEDEKEVFKYDTSGTLISSFDLQSANGDAHGITTDGTNIWVVDKTDDLIYKYGINGSFLVFPNGDTPSPGVSVELTSSNNDPEGLDVISTGFLVLDEQDRKIYKYDIYGASTGDFSLDSSNDDGHGVTADGTFAWVVDHNDDKVYKYDLEGNRISTGDFELAADNTNPRGITSQGTSFWIADRDKDQVFKYNVVEPSPDAITFDAASDSSSSSSGSSLTFSHTVGTNSDRLLVVGAQGEDASSSDCDVTNVTYNSIALIKIDDALAGTSTLQCVSLWYLFAPDTGTHNVIITWADNVSHRNGGGISAYNVAQQAPEAFNSNSENSDDDITTSVTTLTNGAWLFDAVGAGDDDDDDFETTESGQQIRYATDTSSSSAAGSTKLVPVASASSMGWEHDHPNRLAHVVAAFAPANTFTGVSGFESSFDLADANNDPQGITTEGNFLWVVDNNDSKVYRYTLSGDHTENGDFSLAIQNKNARGITTDGTSIWILDHSDDLVYEYDFSGSPRIDLPLGDLEPTANTLFNYDTDRDDEAGLLLERTSLGLNETDPEKFLAWRSTPYPQGLTITGDVIVDIWSAFEGFDQDAEQGHLSVFLRDLDPNKGDPAFELTEENNDPRGLTSSGAFFWVVDRSDDKVYKYDPFGDYISSGDFDLASANADPRGIATDGSFLWVADDSDEKVYKYDLSGNHLTTGDFNLLSASAAPRGITTDGSSLWVLDGPDREVHKFDLNGNHISTGDFDLVQRNNNASGIATDGTNIWVVDDADNQVYKYDLLGNHLSTGDFDLISDENHSPGGITTDGTNIWIVDRSGVDSVYAYSTEGFFGFYTEIGSGQRFDTDWPAGSNTFVEKKVYLPGLSYFLPPGHKLEIRVVVGSASHHDMIFAYDTTTHNSAVRFLNQFFERAGTPLFWHNDPTPPVGDTVAPG